MWLYRVPVAWDLSRVYSPAEAGDAVIPRLGQDWRVAFSLLTGC